MLFEFNQPFLPFENRLSPRFFGLRLLAVWWSEIFCDSKNLYQRTHRSVSTDRLGARFLCAGLVHLGRKIARLLPGIFFDQMDKTIWPLRWSGDRGSVARGELVYRPRGFPLALRQERFPFCSAGTARRKRYFWKSNKTALWASARNCKFFSILGSVRRRE